MTTIIFFNQPAQGHTNPTLPLVTELVKRGINVIYYSLEPFQQAIEQTGATFRSYGEAVYPFDPTQAFENQFYHILRYMQISQLALEHLLPQLQAEQPDAIIYDQLCIWGLYMAQILNIPAISSVTMFVITPQIILSDSAQTRNRLSSGKLVKQIMALSQQISTNYHVKRATIFDMANNAGQLNIVFTSKTFQPHGNTIDATYKFVGPSLLPRNDAPDFPYTALDNTKPLLYISLGTLFNEQPQFYQHCLAAFGTSQYQVVLAIGRKTSIDTLGSIPANFIVQHYVPQLDILQRASLCISHGGMNTVSEALYFGVPVLVIPQSADQPWVAKRVEQLGAGKVLQRTQVQADTLRHTAEEIINHPGYAQGSAKIGETFRQAGGYIRAADEIQHLLHATTQYKQHEYSLWSEKAFQTVIRWTT